MTASMMNPEVIVVKLFYDGEIRRFKLPNPERPSMKMLQYAIRSVTRLPKSRRFKMYYMDEEKDWIRFDDLDEWKMALEMSKNEYSCPVVKVRVSIESASKRKSADVEVPSSSNEQQHVHQQPSPVPQDKPSPSSVQQAPSPVKHNNFVGEDESSNHEYPNESSSKPHSESSSLHGDTNPYPDSNAQSTWSTQSNPSMNQPDSNIEDAASHSSRDSESNRQQAQEQNDVNHTIEQEDDGSASGGLEDKLKLLADMGFNDRKRNIELLNKHDNDMATVVRSLME